jgi:cob(I)alamin adenosyltransferase
VRSLPYSALWSLPQNTCCTRIYSKRVTEKSMAMCRATQRESVQLKCSTGKTGQIMHYINRTSSRVIYRPSRATAGN